MEEGKVIKNNKKNLINIELIKDKNYLKQMLGTAISRFGDGIDTIAFAWIVYKFTGSTVLVATLFAFNGLPNIIFGVASGVISNYYSKKFIVAICDLGRAVCTILIAFLFITQRIEVWHLYVITFLNSTFEACRGPAATTIVPLILKNDNLEQGVALNASSSKAAELIGLAVAPIIIATLNVEAAIIIDAITFVLCGMLMFSLNISEKIAREKLTGGSYKRDLKEGFSYLLKDKLVLNICVFGALINALIVPYNALQAPFVERVLLKGPEAMSFMNVPLILAMTIGVIFVPKVKSKLGGRMIFISGGVILGVNYCLLVLNKMLNANIIEIVLSIETFLMGLGIIFINFPIQIAMYKKVQKEYLTRVSAIFNAIVLSAIPITSCVVGMISNYIGVGEIFILFGGLTIVIFSLQYLNGQITKLNEI
ncbi:MFS transporter [Clostridium sp. YIM B02551]|uniref:MFS transporter n=1 Tax=Clostridium sp. YIM B02551 TaxID=2910679 RepID=UPI001EE9C4A2|nr:MFS transporter [Clostridium sp. YIM B02551]